MINERILYIVISRKSRSYMHLHEKKVVIILTLRAVSIIDTINKKIAKMNHACAYVTYLK